MTEKDDNQQPWNASFDETKPVGETYSRVALQKHKRRVSSITLWGGVVVALVIGGIALSTVGHHSREVTAERQSDSSRDLFVEIGSSSVDRVSSHKSSDREDFDIHKSSEKATKSKSDTKPSSTHEQVVSEPDDDVTPMPAESSSEVMSSEISSSEMSSESSSESTESSAVLQPGPGQGLYSWALAHGTTAENVYALNPGVTADNWANFIGQSLRVQ